MYSIVCLLLFYREGAEVIYAKETLWMIYFSTFAAVVLAYNTIQHITHNIQSGLLQQ